MLMNNRQQYGHLIINQDWSRMDANRDNEYLPEPEPSPHIVATSTTAIDDDAATMTRTNISSPLTVAPPPRRGKHCTLKDRIKYNMLHDSIASSVAVASTPSGPRGEEDDSRKKSILAAASALASLGVTSPTPSFNSGGENAVSSASPMGCEEMGQEKKNYQTIMPSNATMSSGDVPTSSASSEGPCYNNMNGIAASNNATGHDANLLSLVSPPPTPSRPQPPCEMSGIARPFASLLGTGSDIPLTFPQKLMEVLSDPEISNVITWLPHGKGFIILQKLKFSINIMPLYFKHSKFTSFTRKLNRWGFTRVSKGPEMGAYYHKFFHRGNYLLCMQMHCQSYTKPSSSSSTKDDSTMDIDTASPPAPSSNVTSAMSSLELDQVDERKMNSPVSPLPSATHTNEFVQTGEASNAAYDACQLAPFTTKPSRVVANFGNQHHHLQRYQHESNANSTFDLFSRQQEILHRDNREQGRGALNSDRAFRFGQGSGDVNQFQGRSMQSGISQLPLKSAMRQQPSLQQRSYQGNPMQIQHQQPRHSNLDEAAVIQKQLPQNHPLAIANAMSALESCSDQALLSALIAKENSHGTSLTPQGSGSSSTPAKSPYQIQCRVHAAMQAQLRQLNEYNQENHNTVTNMDSSSNAHEDLSRATMLAQIRHLEKMNNARVAKMGNKGRVGTTMKAPLLMNGGQISQNQVAQLYNEIAARQQQQHVASSASGVSTTHSGGRLKKKYPRGVRRASAA